ncbi:MAG TPA: MoaD/ThiS family protein [Saprospiraceae bacterium]|nr:MoaD/ThiS family protein [Saprospiraceae bacterium]
MKILAFGKLTDILRQPEQELSGPETVAELRARLESSYPELKNMRYLIAVDKKTANDQTTLTEHSEVALLPPFSGG